MNKLRLLILIAGPLPIILAAFGVTQWAKSDPRRSPADNLAFVRASRGGEASATEPVAQSPATPSPVDREQLTRACEKKAVSVAEQLGKGCEVIVRSPYVLAGNMSVKQLDTWHRQTVGPYSRAMAAAYFKVSPSEPITVLLFTDETNYDHYAKQLYGDVGISVYGYYKPHLRTLVMNINTGGGTLVHELTHALIDFDFPQVPDWFNEGLASLHEQCRIRQHESGIDGLVNWRLPALQEAVNQGRLRSLAQLFADKDFRGDAMRLNYAQARYFCMYMQEQGVLSEFYRQFRADHENDPTGAKAVLKVFPGQDWAKLDRNYQAWVKTLKPRLNSGRRTK